MHCTPLPLHCLLSFWPKAPTAVTALPTPLSNNSIPHAHLTLPISDVVYLTCFYTQLVQLFPCWTTLCLEIVLTFKPYSSRHVLSAHMSTASCSSTLLGLLLHDIMPVQALQSHIQLYLVSSRMKYRQQFKAIDLLQKYTWSILHYEKLNQ